MSEEIKQEEKKVVSEEQLLINAMITSASRMFSYFYDNKDNISKVDLFKVLLEEKLRAFNIKFPEEMDKFLFKDETATEHMKNLLALNLHMGDIKTNKIVRERLNEWKETYLEENKEEEKLEEK